MKNRKKLFFLLTLLVFVIVPTQSYLASQFDGYLRIGLRQYFANRSEINIYSQYLQVGVFSGGNFQEFGGLYSQGNFTVRPAATAFSRIDDAFATLGQAQLFSAYHPGSVPAFVGHGYWGHWAVYLPYGQTNYPVPANNSRIVIYNGNQPVLISDNTHSILHFKDISGITDLGIRQYRGVLEISRLRESSVSAVNIVHMNEYLFSVVPSEMPASWEMEALKAQAVAARTFTLYRMASWAGQDYNLCDTVFSQVYSGIFREHYRTTQAVLETDGLIMLYDGQPILAAYSSCAGGHTANSEDVWFASLPYLRGVPERHNATDMLWTRTITLSQINQLLASANVQIGNAAAVNLVHNQQGRVMQLIILGTTGSHILERENIRSFFGPLDGSSLRSRNFIIAGTSVATSPPQAQSVNVYIATATGLTQSTLTELGLPTQSIAVITAQGLSTIDAPTIPTFAENINITSNGYYIHLEGRGWGHGVGMSQHGARAMAQMGYNFRQILHWYYTGIQIVYM